MQSLPTKSVDVASLYEAIERVMANIPPQGPTPLSAPAAIDTETALYQLGGDQDLMREAAVIFLGETPTMWSWLDTEVRRGDARGVERAAHKLKGALLSLAATPAAEQARELEAMGRAGDLSRAAPTLQALADEMRRVSLTLRGIANGGVP